MQQVRSLGVAYLVLCTTQPGDQQSHIYRLDQLPALRLRVLETTAQLYKERAKAVRRQVRSHTEHKALVRGNFLAGLLEEAAGDLDAAAKAFHVALSALVEAAKQSPEPSAFISSVSEASDALAMHVVTCLAGGGEPGDATAYLRAHLAWAGAPPDRRARLYLAIASAYPSRLEGAMWCLRAVELMRGLRPLPVPELREALTRAFDAFTEAGHCIRHLVYLSMVSARLFQAQENLLVLSQTLIESGWPSLSRLLLAGAPTPARNPAALWLLAESDEEAASGLEAVSGTLVFKHVMDTALFPAACRFTAEGHVEVGLCNMSPVVLQISRLELCLALPDSERSVTVPVDEEEELVPGAFSFKTHQLPEGDFAARLLSLRVVTSTGLVLAYPASALSDIGTLYSVPADDQRWHQPFLRSLHAFTERSRQRRARPRRPPVPSVTCATEGLTATGCPVRLSFASAMAGVLIVLIGTDHGVSDDLMRPVPVDETVSITWATPGPKTVAFELRHADGASFGTLSHSLSLSHPLSIQFRSQMMQNAILLLADIEAHLDGMQLTRWELWDSGSGASYPCLFVPKAPLDAFMKGDVLRLAFRLNDDDPASASPLLRLSWACGGQRACVSEECPPALLAPPRSGLLLLRTRLECSRARVGECIRLTWTLENGTAQNHLLSLAMDAQQLLDTEHWVYDGPLVFEAALEPGGTIVLEARLVALCQGLLAPPRLLVSSRQQQQHDSLPLDLAPSPFLLVLD